MSSLANGMRMELRARLSPLIQTNFRVKQQIFDDKQSPLSGMELIKQLNTFEDTAGLRQALWRLKDALREESDANKLKESRDALCAWWSNAQLPPAMHAQVLDLLTDDRITLPTDFETLAAVLSMLPVWLKLDDSVNAIGLDFLHKGFSERRQTLPKEVLGASAQLLSWFYLPELQDYLLTLRIDDPDTASIVDAIIKIGLNQA